jgi:WD40 repeat protein
MDKNVLVTNLGGHEDLALAAAVDAKRDLAVTAARDTTLRAWRPSTGKPLCDMRGHTGPVTSILLCPVDGSVVSGSLDCSVKLWNVDDNVGTLSKSIYTFNGIKCLCWLPEATSGRDKRRIVVTGSDGGKVEAFDLDKESSASMLALRDAHDDAVTAVDAVATSDGDSSFMLAAGSRNGRIKVWRVSLEGETCQAITQYVSKDTRGAADDLESHHVRCVLSLRFLPGLSHRVAYGDAGHNLKVLDWRAKKLRKLANHDSKEGGGFTDSISLVSEDKTGSDGAILAATSFDVDTGVGRINFFHCWHDGDDWPLPKYVCSWQDDDAGRMLGLSLSSDGDTLSAVTAGRECRVWRVGGKLPRRANAVVLRPLGLVLPGHAIDSGSSDSEDDDLASGRSSVNDSDQHGDIVSEEGHAGSSGWSCAIL